MESETSRQQARFCEPGVCHLSRLRAKRSGQPRCCLLWRFWTVMVSPESLLRRDGEPEIEFVTALGTLQAFSLVSVEKSGTIFKIHRLVQFSTQKWLDFQGTLVKWQEDALRLLSETFPSGIYENWSICRSLYPHTLAVLEYSYKTYGFLLPLAQLLHNVAWYDEDQSSLEAAYSKISLAVQVKEEKLGKEHPETLISMNSLGLALKSQGHYGSAEGVLRRVHEQEERLFRRESPDSLTTMNNLAIVLRHQGMLNEAHALYWRVIEGRQRMLGEQHAKTLESMNNRAIGLLMEGKYQESEDMHRRVLELKSKTMEEDDPSLLISVGNEITIRVVVCAQHRRE